MLPMTPARQAAARKMVSETEREAIVALAAEVEQLVNRRLQLGLSGETISAIAAAVRLTLREEIDAAIYHQRSLEYPGMPTI